MSLARTSWMGLCLLISTALPLRADLELAREGATAYVVVLPDNPTLVDAYAVRVLTNTLHHMTGAVFPVVTPAQFAPPLPKPAIFVGLSAPALARLGAAEPLAGLAEEEHVARSHGADIFLYGQDARGDLYGVMNFLRHSLGWRWHSVFGHPAIPQRPNLVLEPFERKEGFSFAYRCVVPYHGDDFYYQQGANMAWLWVATDPRWPGRVERGIMSATDGRTWIGGCHTLDQYLPPTPATKLWDPWTWIEKRDWFATNPDFFTMDAAGRRVPNRQLCFANRAMREELTLRVLEDIARQGKNAHVTVGANDLSGRFCHCPECGALEERYQSPGGAYFDYLLELSHRLKREAPDARLKGVAYWRDQSQIPPTLPEGTAFADNFIILFAPVGDAYLGDWSQPDPQMQETYAHLRAWTRLASETWIFYYPNPYGTGQVMPVGNVGRLITALRMAHAAGVTGFYLEHGSGVLEGGNFTELLQLVFLRLTEDIDCDIDAVIREFTDAQYGAAGELVRTYLDELEQGRMAIQVMPRGMTYASGAFVAGNWPYLTPENIRRWHGYFDRMEALTAGSAGALANVQRLRRNLEFATLFKWFELAERFPEYFDDYTRHAGRIEAVNQAERADLRIRPQPLGTQILRNFISAIRGGGEKPLPAEFDGIDRARIRTFLPANRAPGTQGLRDDPRAAFGFAPSVHKPTLPFTLGFYQGDTKVHGPRLSITQDQITPGQFRLYRLGTVTLTPDSMLWFGGAWGLAQELNDLWQPGVPNVWDAYVSIQFQGPAFGGQPVQGLLYDEVDLVLVDRVFMVRHEAEE